MSNGRLLGVWSGAQSPAIQVIANDNAKALAPGKMRGAHSKEQAHATFLTRADFFGPLFRLSFTTFQTSNQKLTGVMRGVDPWQNVVRI